MSPVAETGAGAVLDSPYLHLPDFGRLHLLHYGDHDHNPVGAASLLLDGIDEQGGAVDSDHVGDFAGAGTDRDHPICPSPNAAHHIFGVPGDQSRALADPFHRCRGE